MTEPLIYSVGTQVVVQKETYDVNRRIAHPAGSVGVIVRSPIDRTHAYRVKFNDGFEAAVHHDQLIGLSEFKRDPIRGNAESSLIDLHERVISGIDVLREGKVTVEVGQQREQLLGIKRGEVPFAEADAWRKRLQVEFEQAFQKTTLPDRPDYERVNAFLIHARKLAMQKELP